MAKKNLGELEELVLLAIVRLGESAYGLSIVDELKRTADRPVSRASVYVLLRRLEAAGLISSNPEEPGQGKGRPRRYVKVEPRGLALLRDARDTRLRMWRGIEGALEEG